MTSPAHELGVGPTSLPGDPLSDKQRHQTTGCLALLLIPLICAGLFWTGYDMGAKRMERTMRCENVMRAVPADAPMDAALAALKTCERLGVDEDDLLAIILG